MSRLLPGPTSHAVICTDRPRETVAAWCGWLRQREFGRGRLGQEQARAWRAPGLADAEAVWLANELGEPWLCVVRDDDVRPVDAFAHSGWLSLEVGVREIEALRESLRGSPFEILGEPMPLDVSDGVWAMQLRGPAGEIAYLTEIRADVPGFELTRARCDVDRLFIPVLLAASRDRALQIWKRFAGLRILRLETRITVINQARGLPTETRHPIATVQLAGGNLVEIDELRGLRERPRADGRLPPGIAIVGVECADVAAVGPEQKMYGAGAGPFANRGAALIDGAGGELIEFIEPAADGSEARHLQSRLS